MFCRGRRWSLLVIVYLAVYLALLLPACTRKQTPAIQRLAIVPFENLSSDAGLDWARRAQAEVVVYDLEGSPDVHAQTVDSVSGAYSVQASRVLEGYYSERSGSLEVRATLEDLENKKTVESFEFRGPVAEGPLPLMNQLAKRLSPVARTFATANREAFRAYGEALSAADRASALRSLENATALDPHFTAAYLVRAQILLAAGDRAGGLQVISAANGETPDAIDQAELDYVAASAVGDTNARAKALEALTRLTRADSKPFKELADLQFIQRKFQDAVRNYEAVARLTPDDTGTWNQMGYAYALAQNLAGARRALENYRRLVPDDTNALDSLGEVSFYLGDFANAEKYFVQAHQKNPAAQEGGELSKAAQARLMAGDLAGADALFQKYLDAAQPGQRALAGYRQAQWEFLTGRRKAAMARLEQLIPAVDANAQTVELCQLSLWKLQTGSAKAAVDLAEQAVARAQSPQARTLSTAVAAFVGNGTPSSAYSLLLARKYAEAIPLLDALYRQTNPSVDGQIRTLLAWAEVETGRVSEARSLLTIYPIPLSTGDPLFSTLVFPRFLFLRGKALQGEEAKRSHELYLKYAGDLPDQ